MKQVVLAAGLMLVAATAAQSQSSLWPLNTICSVTAPAEAGQVQLTILASVSESADGSKTERMYVRFTTSEKLSDVATTFTGAKLAVSNTLESTDATITGGPAGSNYVVTVAFPVIDQAVLKAISNGSDIAVTLPTADGDKVLSTTLKGSGLAARKLRQCVS